MNMIIQYNNAHHYSHAEHKGLFTGESTPVLPGKQNKRNKTVLTFYWTILQARL